MKLSSISGPSGPLFAILLVAACSGAIGNAGTLAPQSPGDESAFKDSFGRLLEFVRTQGKPVADDELVGSDVILPPPDVSLEEARAEFTGEGLIPG